MDDTPDELLPDTLDLDKKEIAKSYAEDLLGIIGMSSGAVALLSEPEDIYCKQATEYCQEIQEGVSYISQYDELGGGLMLAGGLLMTWQGGTKILSESNEIREYLEP